MRILDVLTNVRRRLDDESGDRPPTADGLPAWVANDRPCLWKNQELTGFVLDTIHELGIRDPLNDDRFSLSISPGKRLYRLPDTILTLERLRWNEDGEPLSRSNLRIMEHIDQEYRTWRSPLADDGRRNDPAAWRTTTADAPTHYLTDERRGYLTLYPVPKLAGKVVGCVTRTYDVSGYLWPGSLTAELPEEISGDRQLQQAVVARTCAMAYKKRDADTSERQLSAECEAEFTRLAGAPVSMVTRAARQRWSGDTAVIEPKTRFA